MSAEFDLTEAPVDTELYEKIEEYLKAETERRSQNIMRYLGLKYQIMRKNDDGTEAIFSIK